VPDFSDAQSGKDICDRRIACAKSHIRRFLNEGNNINTASDMKKALDSYGGVKGCRASVVSIDRTKQQIAKHKWTGITLFNNFEFLKTGIKMWKAYKIGKGKLIKKADIKQMACTQGATGLISQETFTIPENEKGLHKKTTVKQCQESAIKMIFRPSIHRRDSIVQTFLVSKYLFLMAHLKGISMLVNTCTVYRRKARTMS
jgi:hypothetical protein